MQQRVDISNKQEWIHTKAIFHERDEVAYLIGEEEYTEDIDNFYFKLGELESFNISDRKDCIIIRLRSGFSIDIFMTIEEITTLLE